MSSENPYEVLGVDKAASRQEIKRAYRKKAAKHHPDTATGDASRFAMIAKAYETLDDPERRDYFDRTGGVRPPANKIEATIGSMTTEAFLHSDDPIAWMCGRLDNDRSEITRNLTAARAGLLKIRRRLKSFVDKQKETKNIEARDLIVSVLEKEIEHAERMIVVNEEKVQFCSDCLTYLNGLGHGLGHDGFYSASRGSSATTTF